MKNNSGVTLMEVLIAISILTLVLFAGSGIYLSGMNLSLDAQRMTQAHRNAQVVMMHIEKNVRDAASIFTSPSGDISIGVNALRFMTYNPATPGSPPTIRIDYGFISPNTLRYQRRDTVTDRVLESITFGHINSCVFKTVRTDGVILEVTIEANDNGDRLENRFTLNSSIEAEFTASPSMYTVS